MIILEAYLITSFAACLLKVLVFFNFGQVHVHDAVVHGQVMTP
jgi:hypothetical protein